MKRIPALCLLTLCACTKEPSDAKEKGSAMPTEASAPAATPPATPPRNPSSLSGTVRWEGARPAERRIPTVGSVAKHCGESVVDPSLEVDDRGRLSGVVVWVTPAPNTAVPPPTATRTQVDQRGCVYVPAILAARTGTELEILNSDPLLHNVRASETDTALSRSVFNLAMPVEGMKVVRKLPATPQVLALHCDVHPWMKAWVRTFDHPYFAVSDSEGRFRLEGLPPGEHTLEAWHPRLSGKSIKLTLDPGAEGKAKLVWGPGDIQKP